jgi:4-amino-4-deoxy-L-arabinose transferase-like glycosyltransferase
MAWQANSPSSAAAVWPWRVLAILLILAAGGWRVFYLASDCRLDLAPDEAHYWDWSRHLDWSYYSKGPLVAYLIRAGIVLVGPWSERVTAGDMLAVRLPAVVCGSLLLASLYVLTVQVYGRERLALAVVALGLTLPLVSAGSTLMTIDAPYTCCWGWALVLGYQAVFRRSAWAWPLAGLVVGLGILAKYTMVLWLPSLGLFLLTSAEHRRLLIGRGFWVLTGVAAVCCLPILVWNLKYGWVTFRHVGRLAGLHEGAGIRWEGPLVFVGVQFALLLGFWFAAWAAAVVRHRPWVEPDSGLRYLWWLSVPTFLVFLLFGFKTGGGEPNWPVTAYISGLVLAAGWLTRQLEAPWLWYRRLTVMNLVTACAAGILLTALLYRSDWAYPLLARLEGPATPQQPLPVRRFDPTCRLRGFRDLGVKVDRIRDELRAAGVEAVLAGSNWSLPGELGFYCAGQPTVYSVGPPLGDRRSQYDLWRPNPVDDADRFRGRTFIIVGATDQALESAFEVVEPSRLVTYSEAGQPVATWAVTVCRGFRGFPHPRVERQPEF